VAGSQQQRQQAMPQATQCIQPCQQLLCSLQMAVLLLQGSLQQRSGLRLLCRCSKCQKQQQQQQQQQQQLRPWKHF
jgi:hypothetical protein